MKKIDWIALVLLFIVSAFALRNLAGPGFYTSHDGIHQVVRLHFFDRALRDGQIPPRWADGLLNGYGYPLFEFSYQFPWFIAEPFKLMGFSLYESIKIAFFIGFFVSGWTMYIFLKSLWGRWPGFIGSLLYLFAPFRFSNIFVRGAIGDATAFLFPPLLFLALTGIRKENRLSFRWVFLGIAALTGLLLTHAMVFFFFALCVALFLLFTFVFGPSRRKVFAGVLLMVGGTLCLSAYYLVPSVIERDWTIFLGTMKPLFLGKSFLTLKQLLYTPWGYGTMLSTEGIMSLQVGFAQWASMGLGCIAVLISLITKKGKKKTGDSSLVFYFLSILLFSLFIMLPPSLFFWKFVSRFIIIDFPWRVLPVTVFAAAALGAFAVHRLPWGKYIGVALVVLALYANRNHIRINEALPWDEYFVLTLENTTNTYDEYRPLWVDSIYTKTKRPLVEPVNFIASPVIHTVRSNRLDFSITAPASGIVRVNTVYYPGWTLAINGKLRPIGPDKRGMMEFDLQQGQSRVEMRFTETPLRMASNAVTLITGIFLCALWYKNRRKTKKIH